MTDRPVVLIGPPGFPPLIMPGPKEYTLICSIQPPGIFGVEDGDLLLRPSPDGGMVDEQLNVDAIDERRLQSVFPSSPFKKSAGTDGVSITVEGNRIALKVSGMNPTLVQSQLESFLKHLLLLLTLRLGVPLRAKLLSFIDERGHSFALPRIKVMGAAIYDFKALSEEFDWCVGTVGLRDDALARALKYYACGCRHYEVWETHLRNSVASGDIIGEDFEDSMWASAFLDFWKSLTTILEEPSNKTGRDRVFRGRARAVGLDNNDIRMIRSLKEVRDDFDVAHRAHDELAHPLPRLNVPIVKSLARKIVVSYMDRISNGKPGFGPHPLEIHKRRKSKRSALKRLGKADPVRVGRFVVLKLTQPNGSDSMRFFGRDIIRFRMPIAEPDPRDGGK